MALAKKTTDNKPAFEDMDENVAVAEEVQEEVKAEQEVTPEAKQAATTAIAKAKGGALTAGGGKFSAALTELEYALSLEDVRSLGTGTLPKLVADRAGFELDGKNYGDYVDFQIVSHNRRWLVSAGIDGDEGKKLLRTSYDQETLEDETMSLNEYIEHLKEEGYEKASVREYVDLWGFVVNSEKLGEIDEDSDDAFDLIQVQLSPQSVRSFKGFQARAGVRAAMTKKPVDSKVRLTIERREYDGNKYASIKFS